jgi:hypothetical protein
MSVKTKFGTAYKDYQGYMRISSVKEGNHNKLVHRLVFEDFYKIKLPHHIFIHHDDGDKTNNEIWNLIPMTNSEHSKLHNSGESHPLYNKKHSEETKNKIRNSLLGNTLSEETLHKISKTHNSTGYFRVTKAVNNECKQGYYWRYSYYDNNGKRRVLSSVSLKKLEKKVTSIGRPWYKLEEKEC